MNLMKHPTNGRIVDVNPARATILRARGYIDVGPEEQAAALKAASGVSTGPSAVQPQAPIDTRANPPEAPVDSRPEDLLSEPSIDTRPPNPLGPSSDSVDEADGAGLDDENDEQAVDQPAKSANKDEWVAYAEANGVENADDLTKAEIQERFGV